MSKHKTPVMEDLDAEFKVILKTKPAFTVIPESFIEEVFLKACQSKPLFNGTMICVYERTPKLITTYPLSFKEYLAANHLPGYPHQHKPLAVSGWVLYRECVLLGMRSPQVLFFPGFFELVPSGGIDGRAVLENGEVHYQKALEAEFEEETGMTLEDIDFIKPQALLYCPQQSLYDICQSIHLHTQREVELDTSNLEYSELFWVPLQELQKFVESHHQKILPTSLALIKAKILSSR